MANENTTADLAEAQYRVRELLACIAPVLRAASILADDVALDGPNAIMMLEQLKRRLLAEREARTTEAEPEREPISHGLGLTHPARPCPLRRLVYVAGPMALGAMVDNIKMAWDAAERLRDEGFSPIVPQDNFFGAIGGKRRSHGEWLDIDRPLVLASAAVLRLPGLSTGADIEVAWAKEAGIPDYARLDDLLEAFRSERADEIAGFVKGEVG